MRFNKPHDPAGVMPEVHGCIRSEGTQVNEQSLPLKAATTPVQETPGAPTP